MTPFKERYYCAKRVLKVAKSSEKSVKLTTVMSPDCKTSLVEDGKSSHADPCHLVRVHSDVPGAALAVVITIGVVPAGEGA